MTETKIPVGTKVKFLMKDWAGETGTVTMNDRTGIWQYKVVRDGVGDWSLFHRHELELVEPAEKAAHPSNGTTDAVNGPSHYGGADNPYEVIKVAEAWGFHDNAYLFNALKYLGRCKHKGRKVEDLKKLVSYVNREIALEEAK